MIALPALCQGQILILQQLKTNQIIIVWAWHYLVELKTLIKGEIRYFQFLGYVKKVWRG